MMIRLKTTWSAALTLAYAIPAAAADSGCPSFARGTEIINNVALRLVQPVCGAAAACEPERSRLEDHENRKSLQGYYLLATKYDAKEAARILKTAPQGAPECADLRSAAEQAAAAYEQELVDIDAAMPKCTGQWPLQAESLALCPGLAAKVLEQDEAAEVPLRNFLSAREARPTCASMSDGEYNLLIRLRRKPCARHGESTFERCTLGNLQSRIGKIRQAREILRAVRSPALSGLYAPIRPLLFRMEGELGAENLLYAVRNSPNQDNQGLFEATQKLTVAAASLLAAQKSVCGE